MLITAYLDESGTHNSGVTVVSAYAGNPEQWDRLEAETKSLFAGMGVKKFHAKDLVQSKGDFKGWKVREKDRKSTRLNSSHIQKSRMPSSA